MTQGQILLVDGDCALRANLGAVLSEAGFVVTEAADCETAWHIIHQGSIDLVIVAEDLPSADVQEMCRRLRPVSGTFLIVMGTKEDAMTRVAMLELGADCYMQKPPNCNELVARVRSLLRRRMNHAPGYMGTGEEEPAAGGATGGFGSLSSTEFRLMSCLMLNEDAVVPHDQLISEVWGGNAVSRDCLKFYVRSLRKKLGGVLGEQGHIMNCRGVGYRFLRTGHWDGTDMDGLGHVP